MTSNNNLSASNYTNFVKEGYLLTKAEQIDIKGSHEKGVAFTFQKNGKPYTVRVGMPKIMHVGQNPHPAQAQAQAQNQNQPSAEEIRAVFNQIFSLIEQLEENPSYSKIEAQKDGSLAFYDGSRHINTIKVGDLKHLDAKITQKENEIKKLENDIKNAWKPNKKDKMNTKIVNAKNELQQLKKLTENKPLVLQSRQIAMQQIDVQKTETFDLSKDYSYQQTLLSQEANGNSIFFTNENTGNKPDMHTIRHIHGKNDERVKQIVQADPKMFTFKMSKPPEGKQEMKEVLEYLNTLRLSPEEKATIIHNAIEDAKSENDSFNYQDYTILFDESPFKESQAFADCLLANANVYPEKTTKKGLLPFRSTQEQTIDLCSFTPTSIQNSPAVRNWFLQNLNDADLPQFFLYLTDSSTHSLSSPKEALEPIPVEKIEDPSLDWVQSFIQKKPQTFSLGNTNTDILNNYKAQPEHYKPILEHYLTKHPAEKFLEANRTTLQANPKLYCDLLKMCHTNENIDFTTTQLHQHFQTIFQAQPLAGVTDTVEVTTTLSEEALTHFKNAFGTELLFSTNFCSAYPNSAKEVMDTYKEDQPLPMDPALAKTQINTLVNAGLTPPHITEKLLKVFGEHAFFQSEALSAQHVQQHTHYFLEKLPNFNNVNSDHVATFFKLPEHLRTAMIKNHAFKIKINRLQKDLLQANHSFMTDENKSWLAKHFPPPPPPQNN